MMASQQNPMMMNGMGGGMGGMGGMGGQGGQQAMGFWS